MLGCLQIAFEACLLGRPYARVQVICFAPKSCPTPSLPISQRSPIPTKDRRFTQIHNNFYLKNGSRTRKTFSGLISLIMIFSS